MHASLAVDNFLEERNFLNDWSREDVAKPAFMADRFELATAEADAILRCRDEDQIHSAHTILGRLALKDGDQSTARIHLLPSAMSKVPLS